MAQASRMTKSDQGEGPTSPALRLTQTELNEIHAMYKSALPFVGISEVAKMYCQLYERCRDLEKGYCWGNRHRLL